jgi:hypothetical protein
MQTIEVIGSVKWMQKCNIAGMVVWPKMMFAMPLEDVPRSLFKHELQHVYQIMREGPFWFYLKFFLYSLRYGYKQNPFEVEAREAQKQLLTEDEEELLWNSREGLMPLPKEWGQKLK